MCEFFSVTPRRAAKACHYTRATRRINTHHSALACLNGRRTPARRPHDSVDPYRARIRRNN